MSFAPTTSLIPPSRPELDIPDRGWLAFQSGGSLELSQTASAQVLVLFCWLLFLTSLTIWVRRRAAAGDLRLFGRWRFYEIQPEPQTDRFCSWQVGSARMASGQQKWHCNVCGRDGFSNTKSPPTGCNWQG